MDRLSLLPLATKYHLEKKKWNGALMQTDSWEKPCAPIMLSLYLICYLLVMLTLLMKTPSPNGWKSQLTLATKNQKSDYKDITVARELWAVRFELWNDTEDCATRDQRTSGWGRRNGSLAEQEPATSAQHLDIRILIGKKSWMSAAVCDLHK